MIENIDKKKKIDSSIKIDRNRYLKVFKEGYKIGFYDVVSNLQTLLGEFDILFHFWFP